MISFIIFIGLILGIVLVWVAFLYGWYFVRGVKNWFKRRRKGG
jgi:hypothetical protein